MWPFKKKTPKVFVPETELRISLRGATQRLYNQKRDTYVENILKRCREASEIGEFSISVPEKPNDGVFFDWALEALKIVRKRGLEVTFDDSREPTRAKVSWQ